MQEENSIVAINYPLLMTFGLYSLMMTFGLYSLWITCPCKIKIKKRITIDQKFQMPSSNDNHIAQILYVTDIHNNIYEVSDSISL